MENKKLGQEPAFPSNDDKHGNCGIHEIGMSKRFYAACAAMQGLIANPNLAHQLQALGIKNFQDSNKAVAVSAFNIADELLKQEFNNEN